MTTKPPSKVDISLVSSIQRGGTATPDFRMFLRPHWENLQRPLPTLTTPRSPATNSLSVKSPVQYRETEA